MRFGKGEGTFAELAPLTEMQIKAQIAKPVKGEIVPADSKVRVHGAAWTSDGEIIKSRTEHGRWRNVERREIARRIETRMRGGFGNSIGRRRRYRAKQTLMARATDSRGRTQPAQRDRDRGTYMINHLLPIAVEVR